MALIISGATGTDEEQVIDTSGASPTYLAIYVASFDPVKLDASFRRNPTWRTFGHFSFTLEDTVLWESWINYQYQVFNLGFGFSHFDWDRLGFTDYQPDAEGDFSIPYVFKWALREDVVANVFWIT